VRVGLPLAVPEVGKGGAPLPLPLLLLLKVVEDKGATPDKEAAADDARCCWCEDRTVIQPSESGWEVLSLREEEGDLDMALLYETGVIAARK
jgi:hypothetical protein